MKLLTTYYHPTVESLPKPLAADCTRQTARAIILHEDQILMIYTARYDDYTFPGGGVNADETTIDALKREIAEETGAKNIILNSALGRIEEWRPVSKRDSHILCQLSEYYFATVDYELGTATPDDHEIRNGSVAKWLPLSEALAHNHAIIAQQPDSIGFSILRETFILELLAKNFPTQKK